MSYLCGCYHCFEFPLVFCLFSRQKPALITISQKVLFRRSVTDLSNSGKETILDNCRKLKVVIVFQFS